MKIKRLSFSFALCQGANLLIAMSVKAYSLFFTWIMISRYGNGHLLGRVLTLSWVIQLVSLFVLGQFPDWKDKKAFLIKSTLGVFIFCVIGYAFYSESRIFLIGLILLALESFSALYQPISVSIVPEICRYDEVDDGFMIKSAISSFNGILGPALSGILIVLIGARNIILFSIVLAGTALIFLSVMKIDRKSHKAKEEIGIRKSGTKILFSIKTELFLSLVSLIFNFSLVPFMIVLLPVYILETLHMNAWELGIIDAMFGAGMVLGSLFVIKSLNRVLGKYFVSFIGGILLSCSLIFIPFMTGFFTITLLNVVAGVGLVLFNINTTSLRCSATPKIYRTKLESAFLLICMSSIPFGILFFTYLSKTLTVPHSISISGVLLLALSACIFYIPKFKYISGLKNSDLLGVYRKIYPKAFQD